ECIQDLIRQDDTVQGSFRQVIQPADAVAQLSRKLPYPGALPISEIRADLQDEVALGQLAELGQALQHARGHSTGACAQLENLSAAFAEDLCALPRYTAAEQSGDLGGSDKIARRTDLGAARAVIAEPRRIQRQRHEPLERQPATRGLQLFPDEGCGCLRVTFLVR